MKEEVLLEEIKRLLKVLEEKNQDINRLNCIVMEQNETVNRLKRDIRALQVFDEREGHKILHNIHR